MLLFPMLSTPQTGVINDQTDADGNTYSYTGGTLVDSTGNQAMSVTYTTGTSGYTGTYSYTGPDGVTKEKIVATVTQMTPLTVKIGCPNVLDPPCRFDPGYLTGTPYLLTNLALADGTSSYSFTYDSLMRPQVVTLPTGGQITFTFNGAHNGE